VAGKIIRSAFDENEVALFEGGVEVATALLELPFHHIFFTGSTRVGKLVMTAAAQHLASVTLELGGKSPVIVDADADITQVAADLAAAKQFNGGQACICPDYVFVREEQKDALIEQFRAQVARNLHSADGAFRKENIAQIVNAQNFARISTLVADAIGKGARVAAGGTLEAADRTIHPTLLVDVEPGMKIMQDEIFGPVVPVVTYKDLDEVIGYIASRDKPLALYIYSDDAANVQKILSRTSSGGVTVNGLFALYIYSHTPANIERILQRTSSGGVTINGFFSHYLENHLPFGGVNQSGMGSYHGVFGFRAFSHERAVYEKRAQAAPH
jgi:aldehyde dehydrogenase (NAD+)